MEKHLSMKYYLASIRQGRTKVTLKFSSSSGQVYQVDIPAKEANKYKQGGLYTLPTGAKLIAGSADVPKVDPQSEDEPKTAPEKTAKKSTKTA